jgi:hypothetical protein
MSPLLFKFGFGYGIRKFSRAGNRLTLNGRQHLLVSTYWANLLVERKNKRNGNKAVLGVREELDI